MKKALFITLKEIRDFFRDKGDLAFSLLLPIAIFALIYGALGGSNLFNGTAYIVNEDPGTQYTNLLINKLILLNLPLPQQIPYYLENLYLKYLFLLLNQKILYQKLKGCFPHLR